MKQLPTVHAKPIRYEAQLSCLPLHSVVLSTRRRSCTRLYITKSIHRVVVRYCDSLNTPPNTTTRTTLHFNIEYQRPFRHHINIATATKHVRLSTVRCTCFEPHLLCDLRVTWQGLLSVVMVDRNNFKNEICRSLLLIPHAIFKSEIH